MRRSFPFFAVVIVVVLTASMGLVGQTQTPQQQPSSPGALDPELASLAQAMPALSPEMRRGIALQVALDRAGFSPGVIDGTPGPNTDRAVAAYKASRGTLDLGESEGYGSPVVAYTITPEDTAGPFIDRVPEEMKDKAALPALSYTSVLEMLAERFHTTPELLRVLNPAATFAAGETIVVPGVTPFMVPPPTPPDAKGAASAGNRSPLSPENAVTVVVTERTRSLEVVDASGRVIFHAPVTVGSVHDPLPVGEWKVTGVSRSPKFHYNPELFWDASPTDANHTIAPGPNGPVGVVWIDLNKEHYGIHGTSEPSRVGFVESHGCIRLTNWDALHVADLVQPGTKVVLR